MGDTRSEPSTIVAIAAGPAWHVLHTKSRQEKAVAADLDARGVTYFLPLVREVRLHGTRKVAVETPLFPGYVFLHGSASDAYEVDRLGRLAGILPVADQAQLGRELGDIRHAVEHGLTLAAHPFIGGGTRVTVKSGPFRGLSGITETGDSRGRIVLRLTMLGRAVSVDMDTVLLEAT